MPLSIAPTALSTQAQSVISAAQNGSESTNTAVNATKQTPAVKTGRVLNYPLDLLDTIQEFFQITAISYEAPNSSSLTPGGQKSGSSALGSTGLASAYSNITQDKLRSKRNSNDLGTVILPMPSQVNDANGSNWGDTYLNPLTAAGAGLLNDVAGTATNPVGGVLGLAGQLGDLAGIAKDSGDFASYIGALTTQKLIGKVGLTIDENELLARATGKITNPNAELLYKGPRLRQFTFTYQLTPRSRAEATRIREIVRFFKQNMAAKRSSFLLSTPNVFFLEYRRKGKSGTEKFKSLNKFKPCALVDFKIDNSARGSFWNSYYDDRNDESQPITTGISFSFQEIVPIFSDDYTRESFDSDDVGY